MVDILDRPALEFADAAAQTTPRRSVIIDLDADILESIQAQGLNLTEHLNGLLRFYMDTANQMERDAHPDAFEPGEMQEPPEDRFEPGMP